MNLLERGDHLARLGSLLRSAREGAGSLAFIDGPAGIGKSSLVRQFRADLPPGVRSLVGYCDPVPLPRAFGPLMDIADQLDGELAALLAADAPPDHLRRTALAELSGRPGGTVAIIEDAHWVDDATVDLLRFFARRITALPLLVLVTLRGDEIGPAHPLRRALGDLATSDGLARISLQELSVDAVRQLAAGTNVDPDRLHQRTGGNPFLVVQLLAAKEGELPPSVRDSVLARAASLPERSRHLLDALALAAIPLPVAVLRTLAGDDDAAVQACLDSHLVRDLRGRVGFIHEIAREAIASAVPAGRRPGLHAALLETLAVETATAHDPALLAFHAEAAGDLAAMVDYSIAAAERAGALNAHREEAAHFQRAIAASQRRDAGQADLIERMAKALMTSGQSVEAAAALNEAIEIWRALGRTDRAGAALADLYPIEWGLGHSREAIIALDSGIAELERTPPGPEHAMAFARKARQLVIRDDEEGALGYATRALVLAEHHNDREAMNHALITLGDIYVFSDYDRTLEYYDRAVALARVDGRQQDVNFVLGSIGRSSVRTMQIPRAREYLDRAIQHALDYDFDRDVLHCRCWLPMVSLFEGNWERLEREAADLQGVADVGTIMTQAALGRGRARRGDPHAEKVLDGALERAEQTGELIRLGPVRAARAEAAFLAGDRERTITEISPLVPLVLQFVDPWARGETAYWLWRAGQPHPELDELPAPFALEIAGDWRAAADAWAARGCPYESGRALAHAHDEATLREALAIFDGLGARPMHAHVAARLRQLGTKSVPRGPQSRTRANPALLTAREMDVLTLVAAGLSDKEISERLYLSPKTVGQHVSSMLGKLGVKSRTAATHEAVQRGMIQSRDNKNS